MQLEPSSDGEYQPGYERAAQMILEYIAANQLRAGDRLPTESELGDRIGMSRTVTREALKVLSALGRVKVLKRRGIFVSDGNGLNILGDITFLPADIDHVDQLFEFRLAAEGETSSLAAQRANPSQVSAIRQAADDSVVAANAVDFPAFRDADEEFHLAVAIGSQNLFLHRTVEQLNAHKRQVLSIGLGGAASGPLDIAASQHVEIAACISSGDASGSALAMRAHINGAHRQFHDVVARRMEGLRLHSELITTPAESKQES